jgi:hypothetical protein
MPCYSIRTTSVEFQVKNFDTLEEAMRAAGYTSIVRRGEYVTAYHPRAGQVTISRDRFQVTEGYESVARDLKIEYAATSLKKSANRFKWRLKETTPDSLKLKR